MSVEDSEYASTEGRITLNFAKIRYESPTDCVLHASLKKTRETAHKGSGII